MENEDPYAPQKRYAQKRKQRGLCVRCGCRMRRARATCKKCVQVRVEQARQIREERRANGLCVRCERVLDTDRVLCSICLEYAKKAAYRAYYKRTGSQRAE